MLYYSGVIKWQSIFSIYHARRGKVVKLESEPEKKTNNKHLQLTRAKSYKRTAVESIGDSIDKSFLFGRPSI